MAQLLGPSLHIISRGTGGQHKNTVAATGGEWYGLFRPAHRSIRRRERTISLRINSNLKNNNFNFDTAVITRCAIVNSTITVAQGNWFEKQLPRRLQGDQTMADAYYIDERPWEDPQPKEKKPLGPFK